MESQTLRLWMSDQQWMSLLSRIEQSRGCPPPAQGSRRREARLAASFLCAFRCRQHDGASATFLVRSHNLSRHGMGFLHDHAMQPGTACTVALAADQGGRIVSGRIARCRLLPQTDPQVYEVGLAFDQPIDPLLFLKPAAA
ncbi:MAG: PilZ domain-containing protein [Phycisphaeraceae bacterium]|nr:PilZ domain-containing protein [Phycisphaeraceae bacterium]